MSFKIFYGGKPFSKTPEEEFPDVPGGACGVRTFCTSTWRHDNWKHPCCRQLKAWLSNGVYNSRDWKTLITDTGYQIPTV